MDREAIVKHEDPYYSANAYAEIAINNLVIAREKIRKARDAMDGVESMTGYEKAKALVRTLEGLEAFVDGLEDGIKVSVDEILDTLLAKCLADEGGEADEDEGAEAPQDQEGE